MRKQRPGISPGETIFNGEATVLVLIVTVAAIIVIAGVTVLINRLSR